MISLLKAIPLYFLCGHILMDDVGIRHDVHLDDSSIKPFYSLSVGYNFSRWSQPPV